MPGRRAPVGRGPTAAAGEEAYPATQDSPVRGSVLRPPSGIRAARPFPPGSYVVCLMVV